MAVLESIDAAIAWLQVARKELLEAQTPQPVEPDVPIPTHQIAWGAKVSPTFKNRILWIADELDTNPDYLMACIAWESGETFSPSVKNMAGSGATGLIQFMPATARGLGTTTGKLATLSAEDQLRFVYEYFKPMAGKLHNLGDVYMTILWPKAVGEPDHFVLFDRRKAPTAFRQNAGLDINHDGLVTRAECLIKVNQKLAKGLLPENLG